MNKFISFLLGLAFLASSLNSVSALTINIPGNQSTIQAGIDAASVGDTVLVQPGRYLETIDFKGKDIVVGSLFLATRDSSYILNTTIDGNQNGSVVTFKNGETEKAELCGVTVTGGYTTYTGSSGMIVLSWGSGIYCINSSPYLHHLVVDGNFTAREGGGMHFEKSNSVIEFCVIKNNRGVITGGGLFISKGNYKIMNCTIYDNQGGGIGSAIQCNQSAVLFSRNLITDHEAITIDINSSTIILANSTITKNKYIYGEIIRLIKSKAVIINSIIWNDSELEFKIDNINGNFESSLNIAYSDIKGGKDQIRKADIDSLIYENSNFSGAEPSFKNISNGDYTLNMGSACIDAGTAFYKIGNDILLNLKEGDYRGTAPDMGCFESDYTSSIVNENPTFKMSISNYPNPFNSSTTIHYSLSKPGHVNLSIYSITGQKVIDLLDKSLPAGAYQTHWNGMDKSGNKISSGIYIVNLDSGIHSLSQRIVYMK